jgi:hypothetical protein
MRMEARLLWQTAASHHRELCLQQVLQWSLWGWRGRPWQQPAHRPQRWHSPIPLPQPGWTGAAAAARNTAARHQATGHQRHRQQLLAVQQLMLLLWMLVVVVVWTVW